MTEVLARDFAGRVTSSSRKLLEGAQAPTTPPDPPPGPSPDPNWDASPAPDLDAVVYKTTTEFDALGRPTSLTHSRDSIDEATETFTYDEGGALVGVAVALHGSTTAVPVLASIRYDAKGRRESISRPIEGSTDVMRTDYTYDPETARMTRMKTGRASAPSGGTLSGLVQDLEYTYDPAGNIVAIEDHSREVLIRDNIEVGANREFTYDSLHRLVEATGREHDSFSGSGSSTEDWQPQAAPQSDLEDIHRYTETYSYDASGNITEIAHANLGINGVPAGWTRTSLYESTSNRLRRTWTGSTETFENNVYHDLNGNMTRPPESALENTWVWSTRDALTFVDLGGGGRLYATYDAGNQRLRKRRIHNNGLVETTVTLGGIDYYDRSVATDAGDVISRRTVHVMDGERRIALIETTRVVGAGGTGVNTSTIMRHQVDDHLGSACVELDENGEEISREEFAPYGTTTYREKSSDISQKRYRYTGMERDDETGLSYHSARYYAPWLGRWTATDPTGLKYGVNTYEYCEGSPVQLSDPSGLAPPKGRTLPSSQPSEDAQTDGIHLPEAQSHSEVTDGVPPAPDPQSSNPPMRPFSLPTEEQYRRSRIEEFRRGRELGVMQNTNYEHSTWLADKYGMAAFASFMLFRAWPTESLHHALFPLLMKHWYEGSGTPVALDERTTDRVILDSVRPEALRQMQQKLASGVSGPFSLGPKGMLLSGMDAHLSFGGATVWVIGEFIYRQSPFLGLVVDATYKIGIYDEYDFDAELKETPLGDPDHKLARIEELGITKGFQVFGMSSEQREVFFQQDGKWHPLDPP
ncbi:MAG: RHS repeat-associated core domain-containing protein [Myxococcales bacterium]|nr:RHS repeat-associated core domain-containing protein [Myxococcales bacterium]